MIGSAVQFGQVSLHPIGNQKFVVDHRGCEDEEIKLIRIDVILADIEDGQPGRLPNPIGVLRSAAVLRRVKDCTIHTQSLP